MYVQVYEYLYVINKLTYSRSCKQNNYVLNNNINRKYFKECITFDVFDRKPV